MVLSSCLVCGSSTRACLTPLYCPLPPTTTAVVAVSVTACAAHCLVHFVASSFSFTTSCGSLTRVSFLPTSPRCFASTHVTSCVSLALTSLWRWLGLRLEATQRFEWASTTSCALSPSACLYAALRVWLRACSSSRSRGKGNNIIPDLERYMVGPVPLAKSPQSGVSFFLPFFFFFLGGRCPWFPCHILSGQGKECMALIFAQRSLHNQPRTSSIRTSPPPPWVDLW